MPTAAVVGVSFAQALLDPAQPPSPLHAVADASRPALDDLVALETGGLSVGSGVWEGRVEAPESGFFNIVITSDAAASVSLTFDGQIQPLVRFDAISRNANPLELKAGRLYAISVVVDILSQPVDIAWRARSARAKRSRRATCIRRRSFHPSRTRSCASSRLPRSPPP